MPDAMDDWLAKRERMCEKGILADGDVVDGWTVRGLIGRGGTAEVYHVGNGNGAEAALKLMTKPATDSVAHRHFERECQILSAGLGEHYPHWYGCGVVREHDYLVEELLLPYDALPRGQRAVRRYLLAVCEGVSRLHAYGFVHRDLKPANVMRRRGADGSDVPVLVDFGLAVPPTGGDMLGADRTMVNGRVVVSGTPGYAAPEILAGGEITAAADVHAIGVMAAKCFDGKVPFLWRSFIRRATCSQPSQRYASVVAFARVLRRTAFGYLVVVVTFLCLLICAIGFVLSPIRAPMEAKSSPLRMESQRQENDNGFTVSDREALRDVLRERKNRRIGIGDH